MATRVTGIERVLRNLDGLQDRMARAVDDVLENAAIRIKNEARDEAPIAARGYYVGSGENRTWTNPGRLKNSVEWDAEPTAGHRGANRPERRFIVRAGGKPALSVRSANTIEVDYAIYVHEGFRHWRSGSRIPARPFLRNAYERNKTGIRQDCRQAIKQEILR